MLFFCCCCCYFFAHVHSFLWCVFLCVWFDVETLSSSSSQSQQPQGICSKLELQELQGQRLQEIIPAPAPLLGTLLHNLINAHVRRLCSEKQEKDEALLDSFSWLKHDITKKKPHFELRHQEAEIPLFLQSAATDLFPSLREQGAFLYQPFRKSSFANLVKFKHPMVSSSLWFGIPPGSKGIWELPASWFHQVWWEQTCAQCLQTHTQRWGLLVQNPSTTQRWQV